MITFNAEIYQSTCYCLNSDFNMAPSVHTLICLLITLFVACYCSPIKRQTPNQGATYECSGTNCYYHPTDTAANSNFPENLTDAVLSSLPVIEASQRETVGLLNGTLVFQKNILASQNNAVVLQNKTLTLQEKDSVSQDEALVLQSKTLIVQEKILVLLEKNGQHLENMEALMRTTLERLDRQDKNITTPDCSGNGSQEVGSELQDVETKTITVITTDQPGTESDILQVQLTTQSSETPPGRDCQDIAARGITNSGPYVITPPDGLGSFEVYCDLATDNESWTVFQRRFNGSVNFTRNWENYERGFGDASGEYWLGLKNIRRLTSDGTTWALEIDLEHFDGETAYAFYDTFTVSDAASSYVLSLGEYSGNGGDSMKIPKYDGFWMHNGMPFSTRDRDNDNRGGNCANIYKGGWWYNSCLAANLNGEYLGPSGDSPSGMVWYTLRGWKSLQSTQMKMRRL